MEPLINKKELPIIAFPLPGEKVGRIFQVYGSVPESWLYFNRFSMEIWKKDGGVMMGIGIDAGKGLLSLLRKKLTKSLWFSTIINTECIYNSLKKCSGEVILEFSGNTLEQKFAIPITIEPDIKLQKRSVKDLFKRTMINPSENIPSTKQSEYTKALNIASKSGYKKLNEKRVGILVNFKTSQLASDIEKSLLEINELGIEIIDEEKNKKAQEAVEQKYAEDFKAGRIMSPCTGGPGDLFLHVSNFLLIFISQWAITHIFQDVDDLLWKKTKQVFINIYKKAKSIKSNDKIVIKVGLNIIFILPLDLDLNTISKELDELASITKKIIIDNSIQNIRYKYTFNSKLKTWELETSSRNDGAVTYSGLNNNSKSNI